MRSVCGLPEYSGYVESIKTTHTMTEPIASDSGMTTTGDVAQSMSMKMSSPAAMKTRYFCHCSMVRRRTG